MGLRQVPGPVLKNRGIPVSVHRLVVDEQGQATPVRAFDSADEPVLDERFVQLTNLVLSDIEEKFGDLDAWQVALASTPFKATCDTLALVWGIDRRLAGAMMIDGAIDDYSTALGASFMMANGSDADAVGKVLTLGIKAAKETRVEMAKAIDELIEEEAKAETEKAATEVLTGLTDLPDTPGISTSEAGSELVGASPSSGP